MAPDLTAIDFSLEDELEGKPVSPENVNLPILRGFLDEVETFIKGDASGMTLNETRVRIEEGSLKAVMLVGAALGVSIQSDLKTLKETGDLDLIQQRRAQVIEKWQSRAEKSSTRRYSIRGMTVDVKITSQRQFEHGNEKAWVHIEKYFTGKVYNAGGKQEPNIHVDLGGGRTICVDASVKQLSGVKDNVLFKEMTLRVGAEQHLKTKQLRNLQLIEFVPHSNEVDEEALAIMWKKGSEAWKDVESATAWVEKVRGNI
jgi:hypothetical protein